MIRTLAFAAGALLALSLPAAAQQAPAAAAAAGPQPKLVIALVVDQLSSEVFEANQARFRDGLGRLQRDGQVYLNGFQSHAATETCPGHSTVLSGEHPSKTGIIANVWYDPSIQDPLKARVYCVSDAAMTVPTWPDFPRGPANMRTPTLADWMKAANPQSRAFSISAKDRAAIAMVGRAGDGVFWWDDANLWTTYVPAGAKAEDRLAPVAPVNAALKTAWAKAPPQWRLRDRTCRRLNATQTFGEETIESQAPPAFYGPPAPDVPETMDARFFANLAAGPVLDDLTIELAQSLVISQRLGKGPAPDLLAISLSATDRVGHRFGTQGPEMCDQLAHLDAALGLFFRFLDSTGVPYTVALTADHGSTDAAERTTALGKPAKRINPTWVWEAVNTDVRQALKLNYTPLIGDGDQAWIVDPARADPALRAQVEAAALASLRARDDVMEVFTRADVEAAPAPSGPPSTWTKTQRLALSYDRARSGDLFVVYPERASLGLPQKPGDTVAGHGSTWDHDRRVPIIFMTKGAAGARHAEEIETVDIGPTLGAMVGARPAAPVAGKCLAAAGAPCP